MRPYTIANTWPATLGLGGRAVGEMWLPRPGCLGVESASGPLANVRPDIPLCRAQRIHASTVVWPFGKYAAFLALRLNGLRVNQLVSSRLLRHLAVRHHQEEHMLPILFANSIAADAGLIPGLAIFGPALGLPLSVLAAFLERPFFSRAGVTQHTIWYSLQANFVSLLVGYVATLCALPLLMSPLALVLGVFWPFIAIAISVCTERLYMKAVGTSNRVTWGMVTLGNIFSAFASIAILALVVVLRQQYPQVRGALQEYQPAMNIAVALASFGLFVVSFVATSKSRLNFQMTGKSQFEGGSDERCRDGESGEPASSRYVAARSDRIRNSD